ncbi:MAG: hypothetical protein GY696_32615 [Gammaproteobacteria bacterium]|nr:hypothetical protein [Gammaproteobacteria bacterium]
MVILWLFKFFVPGKALGKITQQLYFLSFVLAILLAVSGVELNPGPESPDRPWTPFDSFQLIDPSPPPNNQRSPISSVSSTEFDVPKNSIHNPVFASANVNSLASKMDEISPLIKHFEFPVFCVQEAKLDRNIPCSEFNIPGYTFFRKDRNRNGGGVGIFSHISLRPRRLRLRSAPLCEFVAVELLLKHRNVVVVSFYNPQKATAPTFASDLADILAELNCDQKEIFLFGDSNVDFLTGESEVFGPLCEEFQLEQLIDCPTHRGHCIDNVFTNAPAFCTSAGTGCPIETHHSFTWVQLSRSASRSESHSFTNTKWENADWAKSQMALLELPNGGGPRDLVAEVTDPLKTVHEAAQCLTNAMAEAQREALGPDAVKLVKLRHETCAWMDKAVLRSIQRKHLAYRHWRQNPTPRNASAFKKAKKKAKISCKMAKSNYCRASFNDAKTPRAFWQTVRKFTSQRQSLAGSLICSDGLVVTSSSDKASAFAKEFGKNFNSNDIGPIEFGDVAIDPSWHCTTEEIADYISQLNNYTAIGRDLISPRLLKNCSNELSTAICALINRCLIERKFPTSWKHARIAPIPKVPGTESVSEFRPISVLPVISKLAEKWVLRIINHHYEGYVLEYLPLVSHDLRNLFVICVLH